MIDQVLLLKEYIWQGNKEAENWLYKNKGKKENTHLKLLKSKTARKLTKEIINQEPGNWWKDVWTEKRR